MRRLPAHDGLEVLVKVLRRIATVDLDSEDRVAVLPRDKAREQGLATST